MEREADEPNQQTLNEQCMLTLRDGVQVAKAAIVFYNLCVRSAGESDAFEATESRVPDMPVVANLQIGSQSPVREYFGGLCYCTVHSYVQYSCTCTRNRQFFCLAYVVRKLLLKVVLGGVRRYGSTFVLSYFRTT